jgi:hypothetical protein
MAAVQPPRALPSAKLPRDPIARRSAVESMLRLRPYRRFLLDSGTPYVTQRANSPRGELHLTKRGSAWQR